MRNNVPEPTPEEQNQACSTAKVPTPEEENQDPRDIVKMIQNDIQSINDRHGEYLSIKLPHFTPLEMGQIYEELQNVGIKRYDFDGKSSILRVRSCMPYKTHDICQTFVNKTIFTRQSNAPRASSAFWGSLNILVGTDCKDFFDDYKGRVKQPDIGIFWDDEDTPFVVFEIGLSQPEDKLEEVAKLWLCGTRGKCKVVIAVNIVEEKLKKSENQVPPVQDSEFGPYHNADGKEVVGRVTCSLKIWKYDQVWNTAYVDDELSVIPKSSPPKKDYFEISLEDFCGGQQERLQGVVEGPVRFEVEEYRRLLAKTLPAMARLRNQNFSMQKRSRSEIDDNVEYRPV